MNNTEFYVSSIVTDELKIAIKREICSFVNETKIKKPQKIVEYLVNCFVEGKFGEEGSRSIKEILNDKDIQAWLNINIHEAIKTIASNDFKWNTFDQLLSNISSLPYYAVKANAITWELEETKEGEDGFITFTVNYDSPKLTEEQARQLQLSALTASGAEYFYTIGKLITNGPKIIRLNALDFELLEMTDLNISLSDYNQPYETVAIELPEEYASKRKLINFHPALGEHSMSPKVVVCHLETIKNKSDERKALFILGIGDSSFTFQSQFFTDRTIEEQIEAKVKHAGEQSRGFYDMIRAVLNANLIMDEYGVKTIGPSNPKYFEKLNEYLLKANKSGDKERIEKARFNKKVHPKIFSFEQNVQLYSREELPKIKPLINGSEQTDEDKRFNHPHWRRGHYRMQVCGVGRSERKRIRIKPIFVNSHLFVGDLKDALAIYRSKEKQ